MSAWQLCVEPTISDALLTDPGIGFIAAPGLMGDVPIVRDTRGEEVSKYRFAPDARTWNHPDSQVYYAGAPWRLLEPQEGVYCWDALDQKLAQAKALRCTAVVRVSPYSLTEDVPAWLRARFAQEPEFPFWRIDPNTTDYAPCWARFIRAFAARYDGHPIIASVDMALVGAWGEGAGSEFVETARLDEIIRAYIEGFQRTPMQCLLHDPVSVAAIRRYRRAVGFRVDCLGDMGGFHGSQWSHMTDFYPQNIENFQMRDAWKRAPVVFEACWHMDDWYRSGWDIDHIIDESLKWHISSFNAKGTPVPEAWREPVSRWVRRMGYRLELRRVCATAQNGMLHARLMWCNTGVAPCYHAYPVKLRLEGERGRQEWTLHEDIRQWLPDEDVLCEVRAPLRLAEGDYRLSVGIEGPFGMLALAIEGRGEDGYYPMGVLRVSKEG